MSDKLMGRLKALYQLAILRPGEEGNEARMNEARTAAFTLLNLARKNGVLIKFQAPKQEAPAPSPPPPPPVQSRPTYKPHAHPTDVDYDFMDAMRSAYGEVFSDFFTAQAQKMKDASDAAAKRKRAASASPESTPREDYKREVKEAWQRAAEETPRGRPERVPGEKDIGFDPSFKGASKTKTGKWRRPDGTILITTQFSGMCADCGGIYMRGDEVWWRPPKSGEPEERRGTVVHRRCSFATMDAEETKREGRQQETEEEEEPEFNEGSVRSSGWGWRDR